MSDPSAAGIAERLREAIAEHGGDLLADDLAKLRAEVEALREALEPSGDTKAAYHGEFYFEIEDRDEDGEECSRRVPVPWTTVKEIMAAIRARSLASPAEKETDR